VKKIWFRLVLATIACTAVAVVALPVIVSMINAGSPGLTTEAYSHITRASAYVAYVLIWMSMLAGLSITGKAGRKRPGMQWRFGLHRYTSLLGLGFACVHALSLLGVQYMNYTIGQLLVPFIASSYNPRWVGLGQVALYSLGVVAFSFYARDRLGVRAWRLIHSLSFALFLITLIHGLQIGSDSGNLWARALYWVSATSVLLGSIYRMLAVRAGHHKASVAATGLITVGGKAQT
jgi:predicted ferric reductase